MRMKLKPAISSLFAAVLDQRHEYPPAISGSAIATAGKPFTVKAVRYDEGAAKPLAGARSASTARA